jgi:hypothetical protein
VRTSAIRRRARLKSRKRPNARNAKRQAKQFARAYGSEERVSWMKRQRCLTCGDHGPCENSHLRSRAGMGRKGNAEKTIPQCKPCHDLYPRRSKWRARFPHWTDEKLEAAAAVIEARWQEHTKVEYAF